MKGVLAAFVIALVSAAAWAQEESCCQSNLMDSDGRVLLEEGTQLVDNYGSVFNRIKVKFCIRDPIYIQLWVPSQQEVDDMFIPISDETPAIYELKWQIYYEPTESTPVGEWLEIPLSTAVTLNPQDRLGIHAPYSYKFPVTYDFNRNLAPLYISYSRVTAAHPVNSPLVFDTLPYPRTYYYYIRFCYSDPDGQIEDFCVNGDNPPLVLITGPPGSQGPPGPPGEPGPPGLPGEICYASDIVTCSADEILLERITTLEDATQILINQLESVSGVINENFLTGGCPDDFVPGPYGFGYCYLFVDNSPAPMQFGAYAFYCWEEHQALPVYIESEVEESFIVSNILSRMTESQMSVTYGTSGMFRTEEAMWVWYSQTTEMRAPFVYSNWAEGQPELLGNLQACMRLVVNSDKTHNWISEDCRLQVPFVCKKPKNCY